jgi:hypothetical protein
MKKRPFLYLLLIFLPGISSLFSCDEIIEPSLAKQQVQMEAPVDQYQSTSYTINFWWDAVDHSLSYHLQVVSPTFAAPGGLVLDTVVKTYKFSYTLTPGNYQWRVMAENGSSQTGWSTPRSFTVVAGSIKQQSVQLTSPSNNLLTNQSPYTFQWGSLYGATAYQFEIDTNNFANESNIVSNQTIPGQQISFAFPKDQIYQWRVRAQNDTAQALWSPVYTVTYDHTPPGQVTLVAPVSGTTLSLPIALSWNAVATAVKYKLYVYQSDGTTLYNSSFPMVLTGTSYSFNLGSSGNTVYWMVTALDAAGNESPASTKNSFVLQ